MYINLNYHGKPRNKIVGGIQFSGICDVGRRIISCPRFVVAAALSSKTTWSTPDMERQAANLHHEAIEIASDKRFQTLCPGNTVMMIAKLKDRRRLRNILRSG